MKRVILPRVLPSASITSLQRYYDPSDYLTIILASSLLHLLANTRNWENCQVLPRLPNNFNDMPCSMTPKVSSTPAQYRNTRWCFRANRGPQPPQKSVLTRLNHFSLRLRPAVLRTPCLTFGVSSACPMLATRWLTYLAGTGVSPDGIIDLARPHTPFTFFT